MVVKPLWKKYFAISSRAKDASFGPDKIISRIGNSSRITLKYHVMETTTGEKTNSSRRKKNVNFAIIM